MTSQGRNGFTLVELLLALALMGILLASVAAAFHASIQSYEVNTTIADATQAARSIMDRLARDVRQAHSVTATTSSVTPSDGSPSLTG